MSISENAYALFSSAAEALQGVAYTIKEAASEISVPQAVHEICERMVNVSTEAITQTVNYLADLKAANPHLAEVDLKIAAVAIIAIGCLWVNAAATVLGAVLGAVVTFVAPEQVMGYSAAGLEFVAALPAEAKVAAAVLGVLSLAIKPSRDFIFTKVVPFAAGATAAMVVTTSL